MVKESSFFEKLKKGMGIEEPIEDYNPPVTPKEENKEKLPRKAKVKKPRKLEIKAEPIEPKVEKVEGLEAEEKETEEEHNPLLTQKDQKGWFETEGQLAIDVYQTEKELVVQSAIAGVKPENLDILIEDDVLTIRGNRERLLEQEENYFTQECYWGPFSREIILPVEVDPGRVEAVMKEGILTIRIPKILRERKRKIVVKR
jgi:HSP20 family molecular chaperone IbpA